MFNILRPNNFNRFLIRIKSNFVILWREMGVFFDIFESGCERPKHQLNNQIPISDIIIILDRNEKKTTTNTEKIYQVAALARRVIYFYPFDGEVDGAGPDRCAPS